MAQTLSLCLNTYFTKKLTTLIDLNYLQGSQAHVIKAEIKYLARKDQTVDIKNVI